MKNYSRSIFLFRCKHSFETRPDRYTQNPADLGWNWAGFKKIGKSKTRDDPVKSLVATR
jgi:hypothetical protein